MTNSTHPDQRFIQGILKNDMTILEEIYANFTTPIVNYICKNNGTRDDANDIIQEALTVIYIKAKDTGIQLNSKFLTYLFAVSRNLWLKNLRKKGNYRVTSDDDLELMDDSSIENMVVERERQHFFIKKMQELSAECRKVLNYYIEGNSMKNIAELMGYKTVGYARKRKMKCKQRLMDRITQDPLYKELL